MCACCVRVRDCPLSQLIDWSINWSLNKFPFYTLNILFMQLSYTFATFSSNFKVLLLLHLSLLHSLLFGWLASLLLYISPLYWSFTGWLASLLLYISPLHWSFTGWLLWDWNLVNRRRKKRNGWQWKKKKRSKKTIQ